MKEATDVAVAKKNKNVPTRAGAGAEVLKRGAALSVGLGLVLSGVAGAANAAGFTDEGVPQSTAPVAEGAEAVTWTPDLDKNVLGAKLQDGPNADKSIEGLGVWPGQSAKYQIMVDRDVPELTDANGAERKITGFSVQDQLPAGMKADLRSLTVFDPLAGTDGTNLVAGQDYKVSVSKDNVLKVTFLNSWIKANVGADKTSRVSVVFNAALADDAKAFDAKENHASQTLSVAGVDKDGALLPIVEGEPRPVDTYEFKTKEAATVLVPGVTPTETVHKVNGEGEAGNEVGDRVLVGGDSVIQKIALDGTFGEDAAPEGDKSGVKQPVALDLAYDVKKFGIVDDYDESLLSVDAGEVRVLDASGNDATHLFDVAVEQGKVSVLAKTVKGKVPADVLGKDYSVEYLATARMDVKEDATATGTTVEVIDSKEHPVAEEGSLAVKSVFPQKQVVAENGSREELKSVASGSEFWYRVVSSEHPANALYPVEVWESNDKLTSGDQQLHDAWSVRAVGDIKDASGKVLHKDGAVIASNETRADLFDLRFDGDSWEARASEAFLKQISAEGKAKDGEKTANKSSAQWELFVAATRTADEGTRVSNTGHELRNWAERSISVTSGTDAKIVEETPAPEPKPEPTEKPEETKPPVDPTEKPEPSEKPEEPKESEKPVETDKPEPTEEPKESEKPVDPSDKPSEKPEESVKPTEKPTEKPKETEAPKTDDGVEKDSGAKPQGTIDKETTAPEAQTRDEAKKDAVQTVTQGQSTDRTSETEQPKAVFTGNGTDGGSNGGQSTDGVEQAKAVKLADTGASGTTVMASIAGGLLALGAGFLGFKRFSQRRAQAEGSALSQDFTYGSSDD